MGAKLPIVLTISGVIGGLISFGLIGLFIGPVVLSLAYHLLLTWINDVPELASHQSMQKPKVSSHK
jgi:predicted PurR-regulated permease PerM